MKLKLRVETLVVRNYVMGVGNWLSIEYDCIGTSHVHHDSDKRV